MQKTAKYIALISFLVICPYYCFADPNLDNLPPLLLDLFNRLVIAVLCVIFSYKKITDIYSLSGKKYIVADLVILLLLSWSYCYAVTYPVGRYDFGGGSSYMWGLGKRISLLTLKYDQQLGFVLLLTLINLSLSLIRYLLRGYGRKEQDPMK